MKVIINPDNIAPQTKSWTCVSNDQEYSGTITYPKDERGPIEIEWNEDDLPSNWEDIEEEVKGGAPVYPSKKVSRDTMNLRGFFAETGLCK